MFSGSGSYTKELVEGFVEVVKDISKRNNINSCLEIGCGDFNVARRYAYDFESYLGADIVDQVVKVNNERYKASNVSFIQLDAVSEDLPKADLLIVRQVLQHLKNNEIKSIISKFKGFKHVIVAETQYKKALADGYNLEIDRTRNTRRSKKSGVFLEEPPFCVNAEIVKKIDYSYTVDFVIYYIEYK